MLPQIEDHAIRRLFRRSLKFAAAEVLVVDIESPRQAEPPRKSEGGKKCCGGVAGSAKALRYQRNRVGQVTAVFMNAVSRRIESAQHRRVRRQRLGHRGIGLPEAQPALRQCVE